MESPRRLVLLLRIAARRLVHQAPGIGWCTGRYPEKIARRLRAVNVTSWLLVAMSTAYATRRLIDPVPGLWHITALNIVAIVVFLLLPLLHRRSAIAGPVAFLVAGQTYVFLINLALGTGSGAFMYYLTFAALGVLFLGPERRWLAIAFAMLGAAFSIILHLAVPPSTGLVPQRQLLYANFISNVAVNTAMLVAVVYYAMRQAGRAEAAAEREHQRSESLLLNVLPASVAARLKRDPEAIIADAFSEASVLFADLAGFTARGAATTPVELVRFLNDVFCRLDVLVERHGLEKIKSTGDAYMVVSGVPEPRPDHAEALADLALEMRDAVAGLLDADAGAVPMRIGIASGPVVAGVVGTARFFYDVWGDAVNMAARMEQTGEIGRIQIGPETYARLCGRFVCEPRGNVAVRGRGAMHTWYLVGRKRAAA